MSEVLRKLKTAEFVKDSQPTCQRLKFRTYVSISLLWNADHTATAAL